MAVASVSPAVFAQAATAAPAAASATTGAQTADVFVKGITADLITTVRGDKAIQSGDLRKAIALIDSKVLPYVNFQRMTASAVGRNWRQATPDQQKRLQEEFRTLLTYTYAGAVAQIKDQVVEFKPVRSRPEDTEVIVRSLVRGKGDPVQIDYRVEKAGDGWKIYDVNVLGAWLVETYRSSFAQEVTASGVDGLIAKLAERNKQLAAKKPAG
ncbi:MAG: ABC transporter substrate-binding protein [Aquabacterium sp.]|uniref:MlaC/ttg2D family ABC transporter substrate-binding protein n=1 Tax=Aquabacterium sp. TaxID=1872578 RepID=UPI002721798B|nr:ABC transporter substrate-binding protein [Aquabacterium sp.]MDO9004018.1 ABC transporter substrate-binding protein [Aquabacterium sp.]